MVSQSKALECGALDIFTDYTPGALDVWGMIKSGWTVYKKILKNEIVQI